MTCFDEIHLPNTENILAAPDGALTGLMFFAIGLALLPIATHLVRRLVPERRVFFARWGFSHVIKVILAGFGTLVILGILAPTTNTLALLTQTVLVLAVASLAAVHFAKRLEPTGWRALGLPGGSDPKSLVAASISFAFIFPVLLGALILWPLCLEWLGVEVEPQEVMLQLLSMQGIELFAGVLIAIVIQPFLEEVLFRGFLQPLLVQNLSDRGGVVATSILFALVHGTTAFFPIFVLSLAIGGIMLRTRRLSAAWLLHALNNAAALGVHFFD